MLKPKEVMTDMKNLRLGWATVDITPDRPIFLAGQMYTRVSQYVQDPITATALVIENGEEQMTYVSIDAECSLPHVGERVIDRLKNVDGINERHVDFHGTHTHNSSHFGPIGYENWAKYFGEECMPPMDIPEDIFYGEEATEWLTDKLYNLILEAWDNRTSGGISYAQDYAVVGFNRRPVFRNEDGSEYTKMYGDCSMENFRHYEGTVDHTVDVLYTWNEAGDLIGVAVDIPCPSQVHELHYYTTADYWASVRKYLREVFGDIYVLPMCGAAGDQNPLNLTKISKNNKEELIHWNAQATEVIRNIDLNKECDAIGKRVRDAVLRGYEEAKEAIQKSPVLKVKAIEIELPLRKVSHEEYEEAKAFLDAEKQKFNKENPLTVYDQVRTFEPIGVAERWELQQNNDSLTYQIKLMRLGEVAFVTNPFELFTDYAVRVRARSKAEQVFHIQMANGSWGYLPTQAAVDGGSYSSKPASTKVGPEGGDMLVERMLEELDAFWNN